MSKRSTDGWVLTYDDFQPGQEGLREALCTLGNGCFATRGAAEEAHADDVHYPGTYIAGVYNRLETTIAGRTVTNEDLVNCPNWLPMTFRTGDEDRWFNLRAVEIQNYHQELDMRKGVLIRHVVFSDAAGRRFHLTSERLVHREQPHLAAIRLSITPEDWSGRITVRSGLDGTIINAGVARYRELNGTHLELIDTGEPAPDAVVVRVRTRQSRIEIATAARTRFARDGVPEPVARAYLELDGFVAHDLTFDVAAGETARVEKVAAIYTSRDPAISESAAEAARSVADAGTFAELEASHARAWGAFWRRADIVLVADDMDQVALRLNIFHLAQCISLNSIERDAGVPARGLHGEAYRGHVFWDELFIFPPVTGKLPAITRGLLMYRYRRLSAARRLASAAGFRGALYPWQSGTSGDEESPRLHLNPRSGRWLPDHTHLQRHVNLAIAYNVWRYYLSTRDRTFLYLYGAEMMLEISRLFDSLTTFNEETRRYEIKGVMGPDEYHDAYPDREESGLDNNAYTNVMTVWLLRQTLRMLEEVPSELRFDFVERLALGEVEQARWADIAQRMTVPFHDDGIISQFEGYEKLEEFDWAGYREKYGDIHRLDRILEAEGDTPNRYKLSKQADVCMLFYLLPLDQLIDVIEGLGYRLSEELARRNIEYYLARTSHGSTLSSVVHASVLARIDPEGAWPHFRRALTADQQEAGTTKEGIHLGAMAGAVDIIESSYAGIERINEHLHVRPRLPKRIKELHFRENFLGRWYELHFTDGSLEVSLAADGRAPATVVILGRPYTVETGGSIVVEL